MAHLKKNTRGAVPGLAVHFERKTDHHTNKEIDVSKSYLNQDLMADGSDMLSRFNARLNDVYCMKRDDVKALATWIVTLPEELAEAPYEQQSAFFEATTNFLNERYGQENAVAAVVHYDETTPHLHYAFVPVVYANIIVFLTIDFDILFDDSENASVSVWMVIQAMVKDN